MRALALLACLAATPALAQEFRPDAFGLAPTGTGAGARAAWSGAGVPPGEVDRVLIIVGPKSLVAGKDEGHSVAILLDRAGNLVADGTPTALRVGDDTIAATTRAGIADHLFLPAPQARELLFGATAGLRQSPRTMVRVVADVGSIAPALSQEPRIIPDEVFFGLRTVPLVDKFGNAAEEGTAVTVRLGHADGTHSLATAPATDGDAEARFLSRDIAGALTAVAVVGANSAAPQAATIVAPAALAPPDVTVEILPSIHALRMVIGPFLTTAGYAIGDGSAVEVTATGPDGVAHRASGWTRDGTLSVMLPIAAPEDMRNLQVTSALGTVDLTDRWTLATRTEGME